jgi:hypothetical protein
MAVAAHPPLSALTSSLSKSTRCLFFLFALTSSLYALQKPLPCNNLRAPKTIFFKNSPKLACQAPLSPQKLQTPISIGE